MQAQQQSFTPVKNGAPPDVESTSQTKKAVQGAEGYDAQASRLAPSGDTPVQLKGMGTATSGATLVAVQNRLNALGFDAGKADGIMGPKTRGAIVAFQRANGLVADGIAGPKTMAALDQNTGTAPQHPAATPTPASTKEPAANQATTSTTESTLDDASVLTATTTEATPGQAPVSSTRMAIINAARSKIGTVFSNQSGGVDETGEHVRMGWETLKQIFAVGMPSFPESVIKYLKYGVNNGDKPNPNGLVSWCGVFATWAVITGGGNASVWGGGNTIINMSKLTKNPRPGDVGYFSAKQHMCIIASVNGDTIETIDGNSFDAGAGGSGAITTTTRARASFAGFFNNVGD